MVSSLCCCCCLDLSFSLFFQEKFSYINLQLRDSLGRTVDYPISFLGHLSYREETTISSASSSNYASWYKNDTEWTFSSSVNKLNDNFFVMKCFTNSDLTNLIFEDDFGIEIINGVVTPVTTRKYFSYAVYRKYEPSSGLVYLKTIFYFNDDDTISLCQDYYSQILDIVKTHYLQYGVI